MPLDAVARHAQAFAPVSATPTRVGNRVTLLDDAMTALRAMWEAIRRAERSILIEFYTLDDIAIDGTSLSALLHERLAAGVRVALLYDAIGSGGTPDTFFERLAAAGAAVMAFRSVNPLRKHFSWRLNDRDHRKILVLDDRAAFLGGVNLSPVYLNPRSNSVPANGDTSRAFWRDAASRIEGPSVQDAKALFLHSWHRHGGDPLPGIEPVPVEDSCAPGALVCIEGSAPREGRPLHLRALTAALEAARDRVWIASGYFIPMASEIRTLTETARRGVAVNLILPGVSDVPGVVHAARATYGRLLEAGIRIRETTDAVLHAKVSTVDGAWTSIGSSNLDRRSAVLNNEADAVVLDPQTATATETMMRGWFDAGHEVTLAAWRARSTRERLGELAALGWKRLM